MERKKQIWIEKNVTYDFYCNNNRYNEKMTIRQTQDVACILKLNAKEYTQKDVLNDDVSKKERL